MTTSTEQETTESRVVWYRNIKVLRVVVQILFVVAIAALLYWLFSNLISNLNRLRIGTDFSFLRQPTRFQIPFREPVFDETGAIIGGFNPASPVSRMVLVGVLNTLLASFFGILLASILGVLIGVSRLSSNWLVAKLATIYVETFRNIPPLIIVIFFWFAVFTYGPFPVLTEALHVTLPGSDTTVLILSNTLWTIPSFLAGPNVGMFWIAVAVGIVAAVAAFIWRTRLHERTGAPERRMRWAFGVLGLVIVAAIVLIPNNFGISWPELSANRRTTVGGFDMNNGFIAITVALGLYTAAHIAEIIRGSILAVPKGQSEAANAIALTGFQRYRYILLPQAMKIAVPPIISQYLNLVKNTSLGWVVAYAEITALTMTSIGNGRPAPQSILVLMAVYLTFSLVISAVMNVYNRRLQRVER